MKLGTTTTIDAQWSKAFVLSSSGTDDAPPPVRAEASPMKALAGLLVGLFVVSTATGSSPPARIQACIQRGGIDNRGDLNTQVAGCPGNRIVELALAGGSGAVGPSGPAGATGARGPAGVVVARLAISAVMTV